MTQDDRAGHVFSPFLKNVIYQYTTSAGDADLEESAHGCSFRRRVSLPISSGERREKPELFAMNLHSIAETSESSLRWSNDANSHHDSDDVSIGEKR